MLVLFFVILNELIFWKSVGYAGSR